MAKWARLEGHFLQQIREVSQLGPLCYFVGGKMAPLNGDEQNPEIIIFVDLVVLLCKGLQNVIVYQHEIQKLYGTSFSLFCSSPVTFDWILKKRRKIMLIRLKKKCWSDAKTSSKHSACTNIWRNHSQKLSSAWWRRNDVSSVCFLNRPANIKKRSNSYENTQSMAWIRFRLL